MPERICNVLVLCAESLAVRSIDRMSFPRRFSDGTAMPSSKAG